MVLLTLSAIGTGKDIVTPVVSFVPPKLLCVDSANKNVTQITGSLTLSAGNYLATCRKVLFFPCMGQSGRGVLKAECLEYYGGFTETSLEDRDGQCRMSNMGYVSNINGHMSCDPDITFHDEE